jgi:hypothetical protein
MIAQTIQLALAPVFVLVAIGNILNLLSTRLSRIVDRWRHLEGRHVATSGPEHDLVVVEIRAIDQRITLIGRAMRFLVIASLAIGITVAILFLEELGNFDLQRVAAGFFFAAIALLMSGLLMFLRETQVAAQQLRIPDVFLELERKI